MIRIIYRWTIKAGEEEEFIRNWKEGTLRFSPIVPVRWAAI